VNVRILKRKKRILEYVIFEKERNVLENNIKEIKTINTNKIEKDNYYDKDEIEEKINILEKEILKYKNKKTMI